MQEYLITPCLVKCCSRARSNCSSSSRRLYNFRSLSTTGIYYRWFKGFIKWPKHVAYHTCLGHIEVFKIRQCAAYHKISKMSTYEKNGSKAYCTKSFIFLKSFNQSKPSFGKSDEFARQFPVLYIIRPNGAYYIYTQFMTENC